MIALVGVVAAGYGMWLLWSALALKWSGLWPGPPRHTAAPPRRTTAQTHLPPVHLLVAAAIVGGAGGALAWILFGGILPPIAGVVTCAGVPIAADATRRERRRAEAHDAWPRLIEEIRLLTTSVGRSVPNALLEVGRRSPAEMRPAFAAAEREWRLTTDAERMLNVLRAELDDATADLVCEVLLVAHEVGGSDVGGRLSALARDRAIDVAARKDARARQAGVRFARRFVLAVPLGMAGAGISIGTGRHAYGTPTGQVMVAVGIGVVAACWMWAGRLLRIPNEERVFSPASRIAPRAADGVDR